MTRSLTIVFCCNSAFGVANFRSGVIRALVRAGHRVVVVAPDETPHMDALRELGAHFEPWSVNARSTGPLDEWRAVRALAAIYRRVQADLAFHFTIKAVIYGAIAGRITRTPFISVITGLGYVFLNETFISKASRALYAWTLRWSREVWFLNADDRAVFDDLGLVGETPVALLPGEGVDMDHFAPPAKRDSPPGITFLMVARLLRDKGVFEFVEAARQVRRIHPQARFQILGPSNWDNPTAVSQAQVERWQEECDIEYLGTASDVRGAIAHADCIVLPSYREGMPRSLLEASSMGKAVLATDVPGCRDVVTSQSGMLCRARDAEDLAQKMQEMITRGREELDRMGACGRRMVAERFDERLVVSFYLSSIRRLCGDSAA